MGDRINISKDVGKCNISLGGDSEGKYIEKNKKIHV